MTATTAEERLQHALDLCYRYLGRRDRTVLEVRRHLEAKRIDPDTIAATVTELEQQGYLDDARYAQRFTEDRRSLDAWGSDRIERKLRTVGVPSELVERALASEAAGAELEAAVALLERRFGTPPQDDRARERALGLLARKGYELELAYDAVRAFERSAGG